MATNLLDLLSRATSPTVVQSLSNTLGEAPSAVESGMALVLPTLLGGLASKASTATGASNVFALLTSPKVDSGLLGSLGSVLGSGQSSSVTSVGESLLGNLFGGDKASGLGSALAGITGMRSSSAGSMVALAAPLLFGALKKLIVDQRLNATSTAALLAGQKEHLAGKLEPALTMALGLGKPASLLAGLAPAAVAVERTVAAGGAAVAATAGAAASGLSRWLPWLIALLLAAAAFWYFFGGTKPPMPSPAVTIAPAVDLRSPAKIYFQTGKSEIGLEGAAMIKAVAEVLDKDKSAKVDITGYTDKTGDSAANQELSKNRALAVQAALLAQGVGTDRVGTRPPVFVEIGAGGADAEARRVEISLR